MLLLLPRYRASGVDGWSYLVTPDNGIYFIRVCIVERCSRRDIFHGCYAVFAYFA